MGAYPTADQVAHAVVAAAFAHGEDPIQTFSTRANSRGRAYAFVAIQRRFGLNVRTTARLVGQVHGEPCQTFLRSATKHKWWDERLVQQIIEGFPGAEQRTQAAKVAAPVPTAVSPAPRIPAEPVTRTYGHDSRVEIRRPKSNAAPVPVTNTNPVYRRPNLRSSAIVGMHGDPPRDRSALGQGYRPGSGLMEERR